LRGGLGIFYDTGSQNTSSLFINLATTAINVMQNTSFPLTPAQLNLSFVATPPYSNANFVAQNFTLPFAIEWNAALEQAIGKEQSVTITYVGSNGRRLVEQTYFQGDSQQPNFDGIGIFQNGLTSSYNALQIQFNRSVRNGLHALGSYTWSHSLDFASTGSEYGYSYVRGNSDFDVRNNFNAALTWDLPVNHGSPLPKAVLNGWGLDGRIFSRGAFPVSLAGNQYVNPEGLLIYSGLNLVPGVPFYKYSSTLPGGREINSAAFVAVTSSANGNAPRNFLRSFGETQVNFAVRREFQIHEDLKLQFRAETFNILNHPNFGYVDPNLEDATFGQATSTLAQSLATVSSLYQQGGARSMQFALKLIF
jgi:hypothetical protein